MVLRDPCLYVDAICCFLTKLPELKGRKGSSVAPALMGATDPPCSVTQQLCCQHIQNSLGAAVPAKGTASYNQTQTAGAALPACPGNSGSLPEGGEVPRGLIQTLCPTAVGEGGSRPGRKQAAQKEVTFFPVKVKPALKT